MTSAPGAPRTSALRPASLGHMDIATLLHEAKQRAGAARTIDELYAELEAFQTMPMRHEGAKALVRHRGTAQPDLLIIGESPDIEEDAVGLAFQGKAGAMIDAALKAAGLQDRAMLACCTVWRPAGGRPLTAEDISLSQPFMLALIRLAAPKALLLLGASAVVTAMNLEQSLSKLRGRLIAFGEGDAAIPVIASYPPGFMMKQPASKGLFWADLLRLKQALNKT